MFVALVHPSMKNDAQSTAFALDGCNFTKPVLFRLTAALGYNSKQSTGELLSAALHTSIGAISRFGQNSFQFVL